MVGHWIQYRARDGRVAVDFAELFACSRPEPIVKPRVCLGMAYVVRGCEGSLTFSSPQTGWCLASILPNFIVGWCIEFEAHIQDLDHKFVSLCLLYYCYLLVYHAWLQLHIFVFKLKSKCRILFIECKVVLTNQTKSKVFFGPQLAPTDEPTLGSA